MTVIEKPGEEKPEEKTPVPGENKEGKTPEPGAEGKGDDAFLEIEGMGKVKAGDVTALKTAQKGLEKERNDLRTRLEALEKEKKETEDKGLSDEEKRKKDYEDERTALAEDRKVLIDEKLELEFERAGIKVSAAAFKIEVSKLSEVKAAVAEFAEKYPGLVEKKTPEKPEKPAPAGGSPGESPPALDKEKEWMARLKKAEAAGDLAEVKKVQAEIDAHRGRDTTATGANTL